MNNKTKSLLANVAQSQTPLALSISIQQLAASVGFDWPEIEGVINKIHEELGEVQHEINNHAQPERLKDEIGDLLFACTNLARHLNIDPDNALLSTTDKFKHRFEFIEQQVLKQNKTLADCDLAELDALWNQAKTLENKD